MARLIAALVLAQDFLIVQVISFMKPKCLSNALTLSPIAILTLEAPSRHITGLIRARPWREQFN